ncbi:MAG: DUF2293 domain-containing protein [Desulfovermiculus sp.]|nr:DUF2293 domain-containing protein [Desulfovermiculus sp.]
MQQDPLKVFITHREAVCGSCGRELGTKAWITMDPEQGALCMLCADMDHLVFLPSGDAALTRRARKHSSLPAIVLKWSRARKRYERQGIVVEEEALARAEEECLQDADLRQRRREREALRRAELDQQFVQRFAESIRQLYPGLPSGREKSIAEHACRRYSGRIGRTAAAKDLEEEAIDMAVRAHIRHVETEYDELLLRGLDRSSARAQVEGQIQKVLEECKQG